MGTLNTKRVSTLCAALGLFAAACGGDDGGNHKDGSVIITVPDGGTHPQIDGSTGSIDSGLTDASTGDSGNTNPPPTQCTPVNGCVCNPTTSAEFLDSCTTGTCQPFDNTARITGFTGTLPALP